MFAGCRSDRVTAAESPQRHWLKLYGEDASTQGGRQRENKRNIIGAVAFCEVVHLVIVGQTDDGLKIAQPGTRVSSVVCDGIGWMVTVLREQRVMEV
jgi:hypothetical protein